MIPSAGGGAYFLFYWELFNQRIPGGLEYRGAPSTARRSEAAVR